MRELSGDARQASIHTDRYAGEDNEGRKETVLEVFHRIVSASLRDDFPLTLSREDLYVMFMSLLEDDEFFTAGRTITNLGGDGNGMCFNCFVLEIQDSLADIMKTLQQFVEIASQGGGIGINFSTLRPRGQGAKKRGTTAGGPVSFIDAYQAMAETIKQGGTRGLACMSVLNVDHPDIREFIASKSEDFTRWEHTNISVGISDAFMEAVQTDSEWDLVFDEVVYETVQARDLMREIAELAWKSGEPGVLFFDTINRRNPAKHYGEIKCTNPCGEQPLYPFGVCDLGSIILPTFWDVVENDMDWNRLAKSVMLGVIWLDGLIDISTYPLPENKKVAQDLRPIGLGGTGWADLLLMAGLPYGNHPETIKFVNKVARFIYDEANKTSERLADQFGVYPAGEGVEGIKRRNSTVTSYAPTGTTSAYFQCSQGVEPYFAFQILCKEEIGTLVTGNPWLDRYMEERGMTTLPEHVRFSVGGEGVPPEMVLTPEDHMAMLKAIADNCDTAVSKTLNMPNSATVEEVMAAYIWLWENGVKGGTVFRDGSRDGALEALSMSGDESDKGTDLEEVDVELLDTYRIPKPRPLGGLPATEYPIKFNPESPTLWMYITELDDTPYAIRFSINNMTHQEYLNGLGRSITSSWRRGEYMEHLFRDFCEYESANGGSWHEIKPGRHIRFNSILHAIGSKVLRHFELMGILEEERIPIPTPKSAAEEAVELPKKEEGAIALLEEAKPPSKIKNPCPKCGAELVFQEGCVQCTECPYGKCGG